MGSQIKQMFYRNERLYIYEEQTGGLFIFGDKGKYINKIYNRGEGPNDYVNITSVYITADRIFVLDEMGRKILYYDLNGKYLGRISLNSIADVNIPVHNIFVSSGRVFLVNHLLDVKIKMVMPTSYILWIWLVKI